MNNNAGNIAVYPNPATNDLTIGVLGLQTTNFYLRIYDVVGSLVLEKNFNNKTSIDVSAFPRGVYVVEVRTEKGIAVQKFLKE